MKLQELIFETKILELTHILFEETSQLNEQSNIVKSWAEKLGMTYDKLHLIWDKAKKDVEDKTNYKKLEKYEYFIVKKGWKNNQKPIN